MSASANGWPRNIVVDSGVLVSAIDADEPHHAWATRMLTTLTGTFSTCEACITEAVHLLENSAPAISRLSRLLDRMTVISFASGEWRDSLAAVARLSPQMDYADACVVYMVASRRGSFALTLDDRDFPAYRVPFASPAGDYYIDPEGSSPP
ncbi:MAG: PIN domain-containing protein [Chthoniobacteraceae bacterium]